MRTRIAHRLLPCALAIAIAGTAHAASADPAVLREIDALRARSAWLEALQLIESTYAARPEDLRLSRLRALTLADAGSFTQALREAERHPSLYTPQEMGRFHHGALTRQADWAKFHYPVEARDLDQARRAAQDYRQWAATRPVLTDADAAAIASDHLILGARLRQFADVVDQFETMRAKGQPVSPRALPSVGLAYRGIRQPAKAVAVYDEALRALPNDPEIEIERAYALSESERISPAIDYLWRIREHNPAWVVLPGAKIPAPNPLNTEAEIAYYMVRSFGNDLKGAQAGYEGMANYAPANAQLQEAVGSVYLRRGWPTPALQRFQMAETLDPDYVDARIGQVTALQALGRTDLARPIHDALVANQHGNIHVEQMTQAWRNTNGWQLRAWTLQGRSSGDLTGVATPFGARDRAFGLEIVTPLIDDRWRFFAFHEQTRHTLETGEVRDRWNGAGVRYRFGRLDASLAASRPTNFVDDVAYEADVGWRAADFWSLRANYARNDREVPIQARMAGIRADTVRFQSDFAPNESVGWQLATAWSRFSDGNRRRVITTAYTHRLLTRTHFLIDGRLTGAASRNRGPADAPYFNPDRDAAFGVGLRLDHLAWRRYTNAFRHVLEVDASRYWQRGFGGGIVPTARYSHQWRFGRGWGIDYGVSWSRPLYDGQREQRVAFDAQLVFGEW